MQLPAKKPCDHAYAFKITGIKAVPGSSPAAQALIAPPTAAAADGSLTLLAEAATMHASKIKTESHRGILTTIALKPKAPQL